MVMQPTEITETIELLANGLTYHKRVDGINVYVMIKMSVEAAKAWEKKVIALDQQAAKNGEHIRTI